MKTIHMFQVVAPKEVEFPIDMLRSDECYPSTPDDAATITRSFYREGRSDARMFVTLVSPRYTKSWTPNLARWRSFGFMVQWHEVHNV